MALFFVSFFTRHHLNALWKNRSDFCFQNFRLLSWLFFLKLYFCSCFSYIDTKEMGNRDAVKVCVNVEIKFWFMQKSHYLIILVLRWKMLPLILENDVLLSRNQLFCFKKLKLVVESSRIHYFSLKFCACVLLAMLTKIVSVLLCSFNERSENIFLEARRNQVILLFSWYLPNEGSKIHALDIPKENKCANFQRKVNSIRDIASKSCFLKQKTQFLENKLSKLKYKKHCNASIIK